MSDEPRTLYDFCRDWAPAAVAVGLAIIAWSKGAFTSMWHGGQSLGAMQTTQAAQGKEIDSLKAEVATIRANLADVATRDDVRGISGQLAELNDRLFRILERCAVYHPPKDDAAR